MATGIFWAAIQYSAIALNLMKAWRWFFAHQAMVGRGLLVLITDILSIEAVSYTNKKKGATRSQDRRLCI